MTTVTAPADKRFRRAQISPARKRDLRRMSRPRRALVAVLAGGAVFAGYWMAGSVVANNGLIVSKITISGNVRLSSGEALSLLDGIDGRNMLLLNLDEWRRKLLASPWVADVTIRRVLPGTLDVVIRERRPLAIGRIGEALYLLDERGQIIDEFGPGHEDVDLPLVDGLARSGAVNGIPGIDAARAALAVRVLESLRDHAVLAERVSQIDVTDVRDAVVILKGDTALIRIGDDQFPQRLQAYLDLAPTIRHKVPQIDYVDVRFGDRVYVRPQAVGLRAERSADSNRF